MTVGRGFFAGIVIGQLWLICVLLLAVDHFAVIRLDVANLFGGPFVSGLAGAVIVGIANGAKRTGTRSGE